MSKNIILYILYFFALAAGIIILYAGFTEKELFFIKDSRTAAISLGVLGMMLCIISVGKFLNAAPANPLSIAGYIFGTLAMVTFLVQVFKWRVPVLSDSKYALIIFSAVIIIKFVIARLSFLLPK